MGNDKRKPRQIHKQVIRIQTQVLAFVMAVVCGLVLFVATVWLVIKGGPNVGQHLQLLRQYLPGYAVTWGGSLLGLLYGLIIGWITGWLISIIYNRIVDIREK